MADQELRMSSRWLSFPFSWALFGTFLIDFAQCLRFPFASWSKAKAFDQDFQRIPLVLLASKLTGQWWSNANYSSHLVSLDLAPTGSRTLRPRRKERSWTVKKGDRIRRGEKMEDTLTKRRVNRQNRQNMGLLQACMFECLYSSWRLDNDHMSRNTYKPVLYCILYSYIILLQQESKNDNI